MAAFGAAGALSGNLLGRKLVRSVSKSDAAEIHRQLLRDAPHAATRFPTPDAMMDYSAAVTGGVGGVAGGLGGAAVGLGVGHLARPSDNR